MNGIKEVVTQVFGEVTYTGDLSMREFVIKFYMKRLQMHDNSIEPMEKYNMHGTDEFEYIEIEHNRVQFYVNEANQIDTRVIELAIETVKLNNLEELL